MSKSKIAERVEQMQRAIAKRQLTIQELSVMSGVPATTLAPVKNPHWNPKLSTLLQVEKALFKPSQKGSAHHG